MSQSIRVTRRQVLLGAGAAAVGAALSSSTRAAPQRGVPWLPEVQRGPEQVPPLPRPLRPIAAPGQERPPSRLEQWKRLRPQILKRWQGLLGRMECAVPRPRYRVLAEDRVQGCLRQLIRYEVEPGQSVEAYLLQPLRSDEEKLPGAVVFHSTVDYTIRQPAGLEGPREKHLGLHLAQRGWVTLCPRCFLWQEKSPQEPYTAAVARFKKRHPRASGMAKMLWDGQRALDLLLSLPRVDPARVAAVGHSLGAKETLYLTALDGRVQAAVASEGGVGIAYSNWDAPWYLGPRVRSVRQWPYDHHELLALCAPRAMLIIGGESADGRRSWPLVAQALRVYRLYEPPWLLGFFNHYRGHAIPLEAEERIYGWLAGCVGLSR